MVSDILNNHKQKLVGLCGSDNTSDIQFVLKFVDINWGSSTQAHVYRNALQSTMKLVRVTEHVKNFRYAKIAV